LRALACYPDTSAYRTPPRGYGHSMCSLSLLAFGNFRYRLHDAVDTMLTVPRSFLFFHGRSCSQPCEGANSSRGANTRLWVPCSNRWATGPLTYLL